TRDSSSEKGTGGTASSPETVERNGSEDDHGREDEDALHGAVDESLDAPERRGEPSLVAVAGRSRIGRPSAESVVGVRDRDRTGPDERYDHADQRRAAPCEGDEGPAPAREGDRLGPPRPPGGGPRPRLTCASRQCSFERKDKEESDQRLAEELLRVHEQKRADDRPQSDQDRRPHARAEPPAEREQRHDEEGGGEREPGRNGRLLDCIRAPMEFGNRTNEDVRHDSERRRAETELAVVLAIAAGHTEVRLDGEVAVLHERARDRVDRGAV